MYRNLFYCAGSTKHNSLTRKSLSNITPSWNDSPDKCSHDSCNGHEVIIFHWNCGCDPYLVGGCIPTPLKNMTSSIGMIIATQYFWENKIHGNQTTNQFTNDVPPFRLRNPRCNWATCPRCSCTTLGACPRDPSKIDSLHLLPCSPEKKMTCTSVFHPKS